MSTRLVVVDLQEVFADPTSPWHAPRFAEILDPVDTLVAHFEPDVVFTRFVAPSEPVGAWRAYYEQRPFALQPPDADLYRLVPRYAGRQTLDVTTFGKWGPRLAGADELVLAGVSTDCCVIATALAAADAGVHVRVAADACAGGGDESHQQALAVMRLFAPLVDVTTASAILAA